MPAERNESVERALSILQVFTRQRPRLTLAELSRETELHKTTLLRLTKSLQMYGFLNRDNQGQYSLGASIWRLGLVFRSEFNNGEDIRPFLRLLVDQTGETASFFVRAGNDRVCLYRENCPNLMRYGVDEGMRLGLDTGASGLVLRRYTGDEITHEEASAFNDRGTVNLEHTRNPNIASISTPIFSPGGDLRGALTISGVNSRFDPPTRDRAIVLLEEAAEDLQRVIS